MNNGIMFGTQGPLMSGYWVDPRTGDSFTVKDSFFEDGQYIITTMDGRKLSYDIIQNYVQSDKPIDIPKSQQKPQQNLPAEVLSELADDSTEMLPDEMSMIKGSNLGNLYTQPVQIQDEPMSGNTLIINKALAKYPQPTILTNVKWKDFPKREMEMLIDIMDIDRSEIVKWYIDKMDINTVAESICMSIKEYIEKELGYEAVENIEDVHEVPPTSKKPKTNKTKK